MTVICAVIVICIGACEVSMEKRLKSEDLKVRLKAVSALGNSDDPANTNKLIAVLRSDREVLVRASAADQLGRLHEEGGTKARAHADEAIDALLEALRMDEDINVARSAANSLRQIKSKRAVPGLLDAAENRGETSVRMASVRALGVIGDPSSIEPLIMLWRLNRTRPDGSSDPQYNDVAVHFEVEEALVEIGQPAIPALMRALRDESWHARYEAIRALVDLDVTSAIPELERLAAGDPIRMVSNEAKSGIKKLRGGGAE
jgi:HEAT repeat protein